MTFIKPVLFSFLIFALTACASKPAEEPARFSVQDHNGKTLSAFSFGDKMPLVFFGYTSCPDICPTDMQLFSEAMILLGENAKRIQPIFVTIDPERDTVESLKEFTASFHPDIVGITGELSQIKALAAVYEVEFSKSFYQDDSEPEGAGYLMNHSAWIYLVKPGGFMTPDADLLELWGHGILPETLTQNIKPFLNP